MDADFSHRLEDLDNLIENANKADLVLGSRYIPGGGSIGWDRKRKLLSSSANFLTKLVIGYNPPNKIVDWIFNESKRNDIKDT